MPHRGKLSATGSLDKSAATHFRRLLYEFATHWGRDGLLAVSTRHLGWRLSEVVGKEPKVSYAAAAQGIRRFWKLAPNRPEMQAFAKVLTANMSNG